MRKTVDITFFIDGQFEINANEFKHLACHETRISSEGDAQDCGCMMEYLDFLLLRKKGRSAHDRLSLQ
jgi:hypothetical protein